MTRAMIVANHHEVRAFAQRVATHEAQSYDSVQALSHDLKRVEALISREITAMKEQIKVLVNTEMNNRMLIVHISQRLEALIVDREEGNPTKKLRTREALSQDGTHRF